MQDRSRKIKRPRDINQLAAQIVKEATSEEQPTIEPTVEKNPHAVALGRLGGKRGGPARAAKLSKKRKVEIAKKAAQTRWSKNDHAD